MTNRPGDPRFYRLLDEIGNLHARKSADYSPGDDALRNFTRTQNFGLRPYLGMLARLGDKWSRIETFGKSGQLQNESARDSHIDSAVYHLIAVLLLEDEAQAPSAAPGQCRICGGLPGHEEYCPLHHPGALSEHLDAATGMDEENWTSATALHVAGSDEPYPLPNFGPGSPAATTAGEGQRVYVGEDCSKPVAHV